MRKPKKPEPTAREVAVTARQERALDEEIEEQEQRLRAQRRGQLGTRSLLAGAPASRAGAASGMGRGRPAGRGLMGRGTRSSIVGAGAGYMGGIQIAGPGAA